MAKVTKAVIPAAGFGTRFLPATKAQPKEMLAIVDKPVIQFVVEEAVASGIDDILIITGRGKRAIEDHFDRSIELERALEGKGDGKLAGEMRDISDLADIHYIRQKEPLGLGHAISISRKYVGDSAFAVLLGDTIVDSKVPCTRQLVDYFDRLGGPVIGVERVPRPELDKYGVVDGKQLDARSFKVNALVEKPRPSEAPSDLAITGRYVLTPDVFDCLDGVKPGKGGEIQLTDGLSLLCSRRDVYAVLTEGKRYDIGKKLDYVIASVEFGLKHPQLGGELREYLRQY